MGEQVSWSVELAVNDQLDNFCALTGEMVESRLGEIGVMPLAPRAGDWRVSRAMLERIADMSRGTVPNVFDATPMGRNGKPEEVARVVVLLCTEAASYVTGAAIPADGGYVA